MSEPDGEKEMTRKPAFGKDADASGETVEVTLRVPQAIYDACEERIPLG